MAQEVNKKVGRRLEAAEQAERERLAQEQALQEQAAAEQEIAEQEAAEAAAAEEQQQRQRQSGQNLDLDRLRRARERFDRLRGRTQPKQAIQKPAGQTAQPAARGLGREAGKATQAAGRTGAKAAGKARQAAGQAAKQAGRAAARMAAQLARAAAQAAAQLIRLIAAGGPPAWIAAGIILLLGLILVAIVIAVIYFSNVNWAKREAVIDSNPITHVAEDPLLARLKALAGDLKARDELIEETSEKILSALDEIKTRVEAGQSEKKAEILAQIETVRAAIKKLQEAVKKHLAEQEKAVGMGATGRMRTALPKYVTDARDEALKAIEALVKLLIDGRLGTIGNCASVKNAQGYFHPVMGQGIPKPYRGDDGLDIHVPVGTPVVAIADGVVRYADYAGAAAPWNTAWGGGVREPNHLGRVGLRFANGDTAYYGHLSMVDPNLRPGGRVKACQIIGLSGRANDAAHLHITISQDGNYIDPWVDSAGAWRNQQWVYSLWY